MDVRTLPERASLRHLKLEAKRRRAAGEFPSLHGAQLAIAREHGQPSWAALRAAVAGAGASLLVSTDGRHACAALTNRQLLTEPVNGAVLQMLRGNGARVE